MSHSLDWRCDACQRPTQHDFDPPGPHTPATELICQQCAHRQPMGAGSFDAAGALVDPAEQCIACGSKRMYSQKDFNRVLGVAIVAVGAVFSPSTYGLSLVACMAIDYALYFVVPEITVCYACDAIHRGFDHNPVHRAHDPLLAERFRREARAELGLGEESDDQETSNDDPDESG